MSDKDIQDGIEGAESTGLDIEAELNRLAALSKVDYETVRVDEAKRLKMRAGAKRLTCCLALCPRTTAPTSPFRSTCKR